MTPPAAGWDAEAAAREMLRTSPWMVGEPIDEKWVAAILTARRAMAPSIGVVYEAVKSKDRTGIHDGWIVTGPTHTAVDGFWLFHSEAKDRASMLNAAFAAGRSTAPSVEAPEERAPLPADCLARAHYEVSGAARWADQVGFLRVAGRLRWAAILLKEELNRRARAATQPAGADDANG